MKYIDADKLIAEIEKRMEKHWNNLPDADSPEDVWTHNELCELGAYKELEHIEGFLNSLQQEQPEVDLDLDLEKEIRSMWEKCNPTDEGMGVESTYMHIEAFDIIARHFYELGINARKV